MIICLCSNVNDKAIRQAVQDGCDSVERITMATGACSGCGSCRDYCESEIATHCLLRQLNPSMESA